MSGYRYQYRDADAEDHSHCSCVAKLQRENADLQARVRHLRGQLDQTVIELDDLKKQFELRADIAKERFLEEYKRKIETIQEDHEREIAKYQKKISDLKKKLAEAQEALQSFTAPMPAPPPAPISEPAPPPPSPPVPVRPADFALLTWNTQCAPDIRSELLGQLLKKPADILCFQGVTADLYTWLTQRLTAFETRMQRAGMLPPLVTFWRKGMFRLLDDGFFSLAPSLPPVGALVVLQHAVGKVACVVNVQLSQQANLREIPPHEHNLRELLMITQWLERVSAQPAAPTYLLCGTFNSLPEGYVYRFLTDGSPGDGSPVTHALSLASAVREKLQSEQPNMTNDKAQRIALDYIFFSRQSLAVRDCEIAPDPKAIVAIRSAPLMRPYHQFVSASFHFIS